jgi:hypothetical protein
MQFIQVPKDRQRFRTHAQIEQFGSQTLHGDPVAGRKNNSRLKQRKIAGQ